MKERILHCRKSKSNEQLHHFVFRSLFWSNRKICDVCVGGNVRSRPAFIAINITQKILQ